MKCVTQPQLLNLGPIKGQKGQGKAKTFDMKLSFYHDRLGDLLGNTSAEFFEIRSRNLAIVLAGICKGRAKAAKGKLHNERLREPGYGHRSHLW